MFNSWASDILCDYFGDQLSELWEKTLKVTREPSKIMKALRHSFMVSKKLASFLEVLSVDDLSDTV